MAEASNQANNSVRDLKLLETGNRSDVTVTCGAKSWELHTLTLSSRSRFFENVLTEHYQERAKRVVNINDQEPEALGVALTSVYGDAAAVDVAKETANRPTIRFCVDVYRAATFLDLHSNHFHQIIKQHLEGHLDQKLKWIFTRGNVSMKVKDEDTMLWINDLIDGIREASKWDTKDIKLMVMEFIWVGRYYLLGSTWTGLERRLETVPGFIAAMHRHCAISPWRGRAVYAPPNTYSTNDPGTALKCTRCWTKLPYKGSADPEAIGRLWDPFSLSEDNAFRRQWCRKCAASDEIPWRTRKRPR